jgi:hypothetical protein
VAEPQTLAQRIGLTRGKGALVCVLGVALVGVVYVQYGRSGDSLETENEQTTAPLPPVAAQALPAQPAAAQATGAASTAAASAAPTTIAAQFDEENWTSPELAMVVAYDPFALPTAFPQPVRTASGSEAGDGGDDVDAEAAAAKLAEAIESLQSELRALQERGVHVIIRGRDQYVAMIGDRTVHVGDEINGFTVTAIEADGVRVERKLAE